MRCTLSSTMTLAGPEGGATSGSCMRNSAAASHLQSPQYPASALRFFPCRAHLAQVHSLLHSAAWHACLQGAPIACCSPVQVRWCSSAEQLGPAHLELVQDGLQEGSRLGGLDQVEVCVLQAQLLQHVSAHVQSWVSAQCSAGPITLPVNDCTW